MVCKDELLRVLAAAIIQRKKLRKKENTQGMGSVDLQKKREIWRVIFS